MVSHTIVSAEDLRHELDRPPFITGHLPGVGGVIKAIPEHFQVEEVLPYAPCGEGEHVFIELRRAGWNTVDVGMALGKIFGLKGSDVGWAGRKDKNAVTQQTISVRLPVNMPLEEIRQRVETLPFETIAIKRHRNKLKTGHVAANRFRIVLSGVEKDTLKQAEAIAEEIKSNGVPNYYGEQRFGREFRNLDRAAALLKRGKAYGKKDAFMVSVLQSALFNCWLIDRIRRGEFTSLIHGDVVQKTDTGGLFIADDLEEAAMRFADRRITYTGPIYGHKMMAAKGPAGESEKRVLQIFGLDLESFKPLRAPGSRRNAILCPQDLTVRPVNDGLEFCFTLPSGAYATTLLREFTRSGGQLSTQN